jgi:hypothetical protein
MAPTESSDLKLEAVGAHGWCDGGCRRLEAHMAGVAAPGVARRRLAAGYRGDTLSAPALRAPSRPLLDLVADVPPSGYRRSVRTVPAGTWSRDTVLQALRNWMRETGRPPKAEEWSPPTRAGVSKRPSRPGVAAAPRWPSPTTVRRYFGSWSAALEAAGMRRESLAPWELSLGERVAAARRLFARGVKATEIGQELGVTAATVRKYLRAGICADCSGPLVTSTAVRCHDCDVRSRKVVWSAAEARAALLEWREDRDAIIVSLQRLALVHGRRPRWSDIHPRRAGLPSYGKTVSLFGSFSAAVEAAGFRSRRQVWTRVETITALREWSRARGRPPTCRDWHCGTIARPGARVVGEIFGSWSEALRAAGLVAAWNRESIVLALRAWAAQNGRAPTSRDWQASERASARPTTQRVRREFGSWSAALAAAGVEPRTRRGQHSLVAINAGRRERATV